jgi:hypothetical protein
MPRLPFFPSMADRGAPATARAARIPHPGGRASPVGEAATPFLFTGVLGRGGPASRVAIIDRGRIAAAGSHSSMQRRAPLLSVVVASRDELTTTEYAVLALLSYGERSGYDLARAAKRTMGPAWAPSRSQIYKVLPRLVGWDLAESREVRAGLRSERVSRPTVRSAAPALRRGRAGARSSPVCSGPRRGFRRRSCSAGRRRRGSRAPRTGVAPESSAPGDGRSLRSLCSAALQPGKRGRSGRARLGGAVASVRSSICGRSFRDRAELWGQGAGRGTRGHRVPRW